MDIERYINPAVLSAPKDDSVEVVDLADKLESEGISLIHMSLGRPDFDTPTKVKEKAIKALEMGKVHYTSLLGVPELRKAIADKERLEHGLPAEAKNVLVTVGASEALFNVWLNFLGPGDEVLIPTPGYCAYLYVVACIGAKAVEVPLVKDGKVELDIEAFKSRLTPRTKMVVINTPQNPTGMVFSRQQLELLADFAKENDLIVLSDECYDKYVFSGEHVSIASLPGMWERTLTLNSVSKAYSMTGWRIGYIVGHEDFIDIMGVSHANLILCAPSFAQYGAVEAFENVTDELLVMKDEFIRRRDCVIKWMDESIKLPYVKPEGAFYLFFDVSSLAVDGLTFCLKLLEKKRVTSMPGSIYGEDYKNYVRLAYTCSYENLEEGMKRLSELVEELRKDL